MPSADPLRAQLSRLLDWEDTHIGFDAVIEDVPVELRGRQAAGLPYTAWQLLEHMRRTQADVLDFCVNAKYVWLGMEQYWPETSAPPSDAAWDQSVAAFRKDRDALKRMAEDESVDLFTTIPHGTGQTYLREVLIVADHNSYHLGQIVAIRRLLGAWKDPGS